MTNNFKNILVLAPHTDDGELGAGGAIARFIEEGAEVYYMAFSTASKSVPEGFAPDVLKKEVKAATGVLGVKRRNLIIKDFEVRKLGYVRQEILEELIAIRQEIPFDLVLMPSLHDIHQDHITVAEEGLRAFKNTTLLGYELIWNNRSFDTTSFVQLEKRHIEKKVEAMKQYRSQSHRAYASEEFLYALAKTRGVQIGCEYAEAFEVIRWIL